MIVTSPGDACTSSLITFTLGRWWCSSATGKWAPHKPSAPKICRASARSIRSLDAAPNRGQRGGSSCSTIACTLRVAWSAAHVAADRRHRQHVELRRGQRQAHGHGVVDAGVHVENHFSGHPNSGQFPSAYRNVASCPIAAYFRAARRQTTIRYMPDDIPTLLGRVAGGENLSLDEMSAAIDAIMRGDVVRRANRPAADRSGRQGRNGRRNRRRRRWRCART